MLENKLYQDTPEGEREQMLNANCVRAEEKGVEVHFELDELTQMRKQHFDNAAAIKKATEELEKARVIWRNAVKQPHEDNIKLMAELQAGFVVVNKQVYLFDDQETRMMGYYDNKGNLLESRQLTPMERQTRIVG